MHGALAALAHARPSLRLVVLLTLAFAWVAAALVVYMAAFAAARSIVAARRARRRSLYEGAIGLVLEERPLAEIVEAFRPRRRGDAHVVLEVMLDSMRHLDGPPFELMLAAAEELGLVDGLLAEAGSRREAVRANAIAALGMMRARRAVPALLARVGREPRRVKLVALRALASIGDPAALPAFAAAADTLPPPLLPRVASLMLEFGPAALPTLLPVINKHAGAFPPRALTEILRLASEQGKI